MYSIVKLYFFRFNMRYCRSDKKKREKCLMLWKSSEKVPWYVFYLYISVKIEQTNVFMLPPLRWEYRFVLICPVGSTKFVSRLTLKVKVILMYNWIIKHLAACELLHLGIWMPQNSRSHFGSKVSFVSSVSLCGHPCPMETFLVLNSLNSVWTFH